MRRTTAVLFVILSVFVLMFTACNNEVSVPDTEGTLVVKVSGAQARGILPAVSMVTSEYELTICDSLGIPVINTTLDPSETSVSYKLPAGRYTVTIDAKNTDGTVIGSGTESIIVNAGATNTATVTIRETAGEGTFAVSISANDGYALTLKLYNLSNEVIYSDSLVYSEGIYTTDGPIKTTNGFYRFEITRTDTGARVKSDSVRIVNGFTSTYSATFTFTSDGSITIVNEMINIPTIRIFLEDEILETTDSLIASADISGINDFTACWYVDGVAVGSFGEYADLEYPLSSMENGSHEVTLYVKNSQVIWSESKMFNVGSGRSISLSNLAAGGSIELYGLDADSSIALSGFSLEDGVYIEVVDDGSRGVSRDVFGDIANLFRRQNGTFIPIPDENGFAEFVAAAIGVVEDAKVIIRKLDKLDLDYEIDPSESKYKGYERKLAEEYYYINFLLPEFRHLDPSEIVLVASGSVGAQGISLLQNGYLNRNIDGVYNFSNKLITGFAVNMHRIIDRYGQGDSMKLNILNPIHVGNEPIQLDEDLSVILVEQKDEQQYKVVISFTGDSAEDVICEIADNYQSLQTLPRYTDGSHRSMIYPEYDPEGKTITYHLGVVDRTFMFTLNLDSEYTGFVSGSASISLMVDAEGIEVHDLNDLDEFEFVAETSGYTTWAYTADDKVVFDFNVHNNHYKMSSYTISKYGVGSGGGGHGDIMEFGSNKPDDISTGFFAIKYTGDEADLPVSLFSLEKSDLKQLNCLDVAWDPETEEYVCIDDNCEFCAAAGEKARYSGYYVFRNYAKIFSDTTYWTADEYGEYGRIGFRKGGVRISAPFHLDTGTMGDGRKAYGMSSLSWNSQDTSQQVEICLTKILFSQHKIVCAIAFGGTTDFISDVEMFEYHAHDWEYSDGYVSCNGCSETRKAIECMIGPGGPYRVVVSGSVIISVPAVQFEQTYTDGEFMTDTLDGCVPVLFIAPDAESDVEITSVNEETFTYNIRSF